VVAISLLTHLCPLTAQPYYLNAAVALALLSFIATVAVLARLGRQRERGDHRLGPFATTFVAVALGSHPGTAQPLRALVDPSVVA
jgi:hypothetical protein